MAILKKFSGVLSVPQLYNLMQTPFVKSKLAALARHNDLSKVRRVLDVGCGPGTNCTVFSHAEYLGVDLDPGYVEYARKKHGRDFEVADVCTYDPPADEKFDFILLNSLLHHIDEQGARRILTALTRSVSDDGHVHIIDLVLPGSKGLPRMMAENDRGDYPRPFSHWQELFGSIFEEVTIEPFKVRLMGLDVIELVYFKGRNRAASQLQDRGQSRVA